MDSRGAHVSTFFALIEDFNVVILNDLGH